MQGRARTWLSMFTEGHCLLFEKWLTSIIFFYSMFQNYSLKHKTYFLIKEFILLQDILAKETVNIIPVIFFPCKTLENGQKI